MKKWNVNVDITVEADTEAGAKILVFGKLKGLDAEIWQITEAPND